MVRASSCVIKGDDDEEDDDDEEGDDEILIAFLAAARWHLLNLCRQEMSSLPNQD